MSVIVFGSINMDLVIQVPRLPMTGETITGHRFFTTPGGKGANQAVATSRLGIPTKLVGRVGADSFGEAMLHGFKQDQVNVDGINIDNSHETGVAFITVDDAGENSIIVIPGANGMVGEVELDCLNTFCRDAQVLLIQLEIPIDTVMRAAEVAKEHHLHVILDPAPVQEIPHSLYALVDIITPNEVEAEGLVGFPIGDAEGAARAAQALYERGVETVIIKMGSRGAFWNQGGRGEFISAHPVDAVDTVATGDAFNGGLAAGLVEGRPFSQALEWAMAAGAIAATKLGAQPSLPNRSELMEFLDRTTN